MSHVHSRRPVSAIFALILALLAFSAAADRAAASYVPWGTVLVPGGQWAGTSAALGDLNVYSNGDGNEDSYGTYGLRYECVELAQRWAAIRFGEQKGWPVQAAYQMWSVGPTLSVPMIQHPNGGSVGPQFGDILIFDRTSFDPSGHVAVVSGTEPGYVDIVEQNWANSNPTGRDRLPISGTTMPTRWGLTILGWLRASNAPSGLTGSTPLPNSSMPLGRYINYKTGHWVTTGVPSASYVGGTYGHQEATLGSLSPYVHTGLQPLRSCSAGNVHFLSLSSTCEGQTDLGIDGYDSPTATTAYNIAIYRCRVVGNNDHFVSTGSNCEGQVNEGPLGFTLGSASLVRYDSMSLTDHWSAAGAATPVYQLESVLGKLQMAPAAGTHALFSCRINGTNDLFTSASSSCEGQQLFAMDGYVDDAPPPSAGELAIFRCWAGRTDHFDTQSSNCEGAGTPEGILGYLPPS
jgi:hypothetical protein